MSISKNFPSVVPSLNLNFARSQDLDPRITFTRGSSATYVDDTGLIRTAGTNQARFDHDPVTLDSLGLLIEESRTNLILQSETLNTSWSLGNTTISANTTATTAPDGTTNSDKIQEDNTNNQHLVFQSIGTPSIGAVYTFSCFFKAAERTEISLTAHGEGFSVYNLSTGTVTQTGGHSNVTITPYKNGWYRCSTTITKTNTNGTFYIVVWNGTNLYTGTTGSGVYAWGAQVELASFATSYIPTTSATVTRSADNASITGTNFSGFYNSLEWTLMVAGRRNYSGNYIGYPTIARIGDGTANNTVGFYGADASTQFTNNAVVSGGVSQTTYEAVTTSGTSLFKMIQALSTNNSTFGANGTLTTTDTSVTMPSGVNNLAIGSYFSGGNYWGGTIAQILYYPKVLSNAQLQTITR